MRIVKGLFFRTLLWAMLAMSAMSAMSAMAADGSEDKFKSRLLELVKVVFPANGYINKEMHDSLWDDAPLELLQELESDSGDVFKKLLQEKFGRALLFQYATWDSVRRTLESGEIDYHPDYKKLHKITVNEGHITAANNGDRVIKSALNGAPVENSQGMFYITMALANTIINNLDVSLERASLLFDKTWNPRMKERFLQRAHVKTISAFPYAISEEKFDELTTTSYISQFSETSFKSVLWLPVDEPAAISNSALKEMTVSFLEYYGVGRSEAFIYSSQWRDILSYKGSGMGYSQGKKVSFSISALVRPDPHGFLVFLGASENSTGEADRFLEELLEQTQLIN